MRFNDAITGAVLVLFAVAEIAYTRTFPSLHGQAYGPDLFPMLIGLGLLGCGCVLIVRGLYVRRLFSKGSSEKDSSKTINSSVNNWIDLGNIVESSHARINAVLTVVFLLLYILFSDSIGFIPLSMATLFILLYRLGSSVLVAGGIAVFTTAVIQFLFAKVLLVPLPAGWLQGIVW